MRLSGAIFSIIYLKTPLETILTSISHIHLMALKEEILLSTIHLRIQPVLAVG